MIEIVKNPENWVALAFVIFLGLLLKIGAHRFVLADDPFM